MEGRSHDNETRRFFEQGYPSLDLWQLSGSNYFEA